MTVYTNFEIYTGKTVLQNHAVFVKDNKIINITTDNEIPSETNIIDGQGRKLVPSFIDLQIYGAKGLLFSDNPTKECIEATYQYCVAGGANHFLLTVATNTWDVVFACIEAAKKYINEGGKGLLGLHLEGPFINPQKAGAHLINCIIKPSVEQIETLILKAEGIVKMMTLAPEVCNSSIIHKIQTAGIVVSAGHSNATYEIATEAFNDGISCATHLYNAMSGLQHRAPGMVGAILNHPSVKCSVVADGFHVSWPAIQLAKKMMKERLFLITDAVTNASGGYEHIFKEDRYVLPNGTLSGSALTMMQAVLNIVTFAEIPLDEAIRMASLYPARILSLHKKYGKIEVGYDAEFCIF